MNSYRWAILLSGASAVLGLGREIIIVARLGLGSTNDLLQFVLSITYTIALLGEPLRSASLNLLGKRSGSGLAGFLAAILAISATLVTLLYARQGPQVSAAWILAAGVAGAANLAVAWVVPRSLRAGPFLAAHAISVMPNILIVAGLLLPAADDTAFAGRVVMLFLLSPIVQLVLFRILFARHPRLGTDPVATVGDVRATIGWHGVAAGAGMGTQYAIRSALALEAPGTLSAFVLALRAIETIRAVFVDTFIASRLRKWAERQATATGLSVRRLLPVSAAVLLLAAGLALALWWPGTRGTLLDPVAVVLLAGLYPLLLYRLVWQARNTNASPVGSTARVAAVETGVLLLVGLGAAIPMVPRAVLPWLAYVVRPVAGLAVNREMDSPAGAA